MVGQNRPEVRTAGLPTFGWNRPPRLGFGRTSVKPALFQSRGASSGAGGTTAEPWEAEFRTMFGRPVRATGPCFRPAPRCSTLCRTSANPKTYPIRPHASSGSKLFLFLFFFLAPHTKNRAFRPFSPPGPGRGQSRCSTDLSPSGDASEKAFSLSLRLPTPAERHVLEDLGRHPLHCGRRARPLFSFFPPPKRRDSEPGQGCRETAARSCTDRRG